MTHFWVQFLVNQHSRAEPWTGVNMPIPHAEQFTTEAMATLYMTIMAHSVCINDQSCLWINQHDRNEPYTVVGMLNPYVKDFANNRGNGYTVT